MNSATINSLADRLYILEDREWKLYNMCSDASVVGGKRFIRCCRLLILVRRKIKIIKRLLRYE